MADALVPYGDTRIVLRHQNSVVLYDSSNRRLVVRNVDTPIESTLCPHCGRSYHVDDYENVPGSNPEQNGGDARPEYFRMLRQSLPDATTSAPPSPVKQLAEPLLPQPGPPSSPFHETESPGPGKGRISKDAFSPGYFARFFHEDGELGRGGKGVVLRVSHVLDGVPLGVYACKRIPVGHDHQWLVKILAEVQLLSNLAHENLVQYKHVWLEEVKLANFGPSVPCAFVLQQFCNAGDLQKYICGSKPDVPRNEELKARHRRKSVVGSDPDIGINNRIRRLTLDEIYSFFKQITAGMNYLHEKNYVHRDLKPSNCLLHDTGSELKVLVSDFGEVQRGDQIREGTGATGTISYCAPEVLNLDQTTGQLGEFTPKSDIFSLGMVLHFLCFGQLPYLSADGIDEDDEDVEQLKDEISRWAGFEQERHLRSDLPDELYQNLSRLLSSSPSHRPSAQDILEGLESLGGPTPSRSQTHHTRRRSTDRVFDRRASRHSKVDSQSPRTASISVVPAPTLRRQISPPALELEETAIESDGEENGPSHSLILRSRPVSRAVSPHKSDLFAATTQLQPSPKLLPAAPERSVIPRQLNAFLSENSLRVVEIVVLCLKLLSLYLPCLPSAVRPVIAGPLLIFALVDFLVPRRSVWLSLALAMIHVVVLGVVVLRQGLCLQPKLIWSGNDYEHGDL